MPPTAFASVASGLMLLCLASTAAAQGPATGRPFPAPDFALALQAQEVTAQRGGRARSSVKGLSIGVHGSTTVIGRRDTSSTGGLSLGLGYGLTDRFAIHGATSGAWVDPSSDRDRFFVSHLDLEGRYSLGRMDSRWRSHAAMGLSGRNAHHERSAAQGGGTVVRMTVGPTAGGGVSYVISRSAALDGSLRYTFGDVQRMRGYVGVSWYPRAR